LIKGKFVKGIALAKDFEQLEYIEQKIKTTSQINRRTKVGRALTKELSDLAQEKAQTLITNGATPF